MNNKQTQWLNTNCPDGGILQSEEWRALEEREGFRTEHFESEGFWANVIERSLPLVGKYWYVPRGPVFQQSAGEGELRMKWGKILGEAKEKMVGWVRVEPRDEGELAMIREWSKPFRVEKALHDMQPREILVVDISKSEEEILAGMKAKTRYNVRLSEKRGVQVSLDRSEASLREFLRMVRETTIRNNIVAHPEKRYRNFLEVFSQETMELFVARREGTMLAAILVSFFGDTATYLHGASSDDDRGSMAPFLLQFRAMEEARARGCTRYDMGGVDTTGERPSLFGVTRFKQGFAENVKTIRFPGSYDIMLLPSRFYTYKIASMSRIFAKKAKKVLTRK